MNIRERVRQELPIQESALGRASLRRRIGPQIQFVYPLQGDRLVAAILGHINQEIRSAQERTRWRRS